MRWMMLLLLAVSLVGCAHYRLPWQPLSPFRQGYQDGCNAKERKSDDGSRRDYVPGGSQDAYSRGWAEGYYICSKSEPIPKHQSPYDIEQERKKDCNEKHRLCF